MGGGGGGGVRVIIWTGVVRQQKRKKDTVKAPLRSKKRLQIKARRGANF